MMETTDLNILKEKMDHAEKMLKEAILNIVVIPQI